MRQLMTHGGRFFHNIHDIIAICFHGKREIVPTHIHLTHEIREKHSLRPGIITIQLVIPFPQALHHIDGFILHIHRITPAVHTTPVHHGTTVIPFHDLTELITVPDDIIVDPKQFLRSFLCCLLLRFLFTEIFLRKCRPMIDHGTIQRHNGKYGKQRPSKKTKISIHSPAVLFRMSARRNQQTASQHNRSKHHQNPCHNQPFAHGKGKQPCNPSVGIDPDWENIINISIAEASAAPGNDLKQ